LPQHSDRGLLGAVFHELVVQVVEAEGQLARSLAPIPVPQDAEPIQGTQHTCMARANQPLDLAGGQVLARVEPLQRAPAPQAEHGRQRDDALYERGNRFARVCLWLSRGSEDRVEQGSHFGMRHRGTWALLC